MLTSLVAYSAWSTYVLRTRRRMFARQARAHGTTASKCFRQGHGHHGVLAINTYTSAQTTSNTLHAQNPQSFTVTHLWRKYSKESLRHIRGKTFYDRVKNEEMEKECEADDVSVMVTASLPTCLNGVKISYFLVLLQDTQKTLLPLQISKMCSVGSWNTIFTINASPLWHHFTKHKFISLDKQ